MVKSYGVVVGVRVAHVIIVSAPVQILGFCFFLNLVYELRVRILGLLWQGIWDLGTWTRAWQKMIFIIEGFP